MYTCVRCIYEQNTNIHNTSKHKFVRAISGNVRYDPSVSRRCEKRGQNRPRLAYFNNLEYSTTSFVKMGEPTGLTNSEARELCKNPNLTTKDYILSQVMYRIKDPRKSLPFYTEVLGMRLLQKLDFPDMKFSVYFLGFERANDIPTDRRECLEWTFSRKAALELTHNWGTEIDPDAKYHNGNSDPRGYGHIGVTVPDVDAACERFSRLGVEFVKKPNDGKMKGLAFIKDPDGYWIEILSVPNTVNLIMNT